MTTNRSSLLATRFLAPKPVITPPPDAPVIKHFNLHSDARFRPEGGRIYVDGSCLFPKHACLARGAFAAVQINGQGELLCGVSGTLTSSFDHSSLVAESVALGAAVELSDRGNVVASDCAEVVKSWRHFEASMSAGNAAACTYRSIQIACPDYDSRVLDVCKVKAHRTFESIDSFDEEDLRDYIGNSLADSLAKEAAESIMPEACESKQFFRDFHAVQALALHVVGVVVSWPHPSRTLPPRHRQPRCLNVKVNSHFSHWSGDLWICLKCFMRTRKRPRDVSCKCTKSSVESIFQDPKGHTLWAARTDSKEMIVFCSVCWAYAISSPSKLYRPCAGPPVRKIGAKGRVLIPFGETAKTRIKKRLHPADPTCHLFKPYKI